MLPYSLHFNWFSNNNIIIYTADQVMCDAFITSLSNIVPFAVGNASCAADVVIVLENSGQLTELGYYAMRELAADVVKGLPEEVRVGLVVFAAEEEDVRIIRSPRNSLLHALLNAPYT